VLAVMDVHKPLDESLLAFSSQWFSICAYYICL